MNSFFLAVIILAIYGLSLYGWGQLIERYSYNRSSIKSAPYSIALGLAFIIFIGGILNAVGLAYPGMLNFLVIAGLCLAIYSFIVEQRHQLLRDTFTGSRSLITFSGDGSFARIIVLYASAFFVATLLPTTAFNFHDDFHTYIPRLFQMLQTGSLGGNPFGLLGLDSLGAQAFMQSFVTILFPVQYLNAFDAVFCFILSAFLIISLGERIRSHWLIIAISIITFIFINTQQVNISAIYSSVAMIIGLTFSGLLYLERQKDTPIQAKNLIPMSLFSAALVSLKFMSAVFAAIYLIIFFMALIILNKDRRQAINSTIYTAALVVLASLPWFLVHFKNYMSALLSLFSKPNSPTINNDDMITLSSTIENFPSLGTLFSSNELFWGGNFLGYNILFIILLLASIGACVVLLRRGDAHNKHIHISLMASCGTVVICYVIGMLLFRFEMTLRYSLPSLAAVTPVMLLLLSRPYKASSGSPGLQISSILSSFFFITLVIVQIMIASLFSNSLMARTISAYQDRTIVRFPVSDNYIKYMEFAMNEKTHQGIRDIQYQADEGEGILAWISMPFHLDYKRNRIFTVSEPGLLTPWYDFPSGEDIEVMRQYLINKGVRYVLWEFKGFGMKPAEKHQQHLKSPYVMFRKLGATVLGFGNSLQSLANESKIIYQQKNLVMYELTGEN